MKNRDGRGVGHYSKNDVVLKRDKSVNYAGNPVSKPKDMSKHIEDVSGPGLSRPISRGPVTRHFAK
jgi:hypothetical protein